MRLWEGGKTEAGREFHAEFTSERDERMKMLVNSCISEVDRIGMRESRKSCAARPREWGRHAVSSFIIVIIIVVAVVYNFIVTIIVVIYNTSSSVIMILI